MLKKFSACFRAKYGALFILRCEIFEKANNSFYATLLFADGDEKKAAVETAHSRTTPPTALPIPYYFLPVTCSYLFLAATLFHNVLIMES